MYRPTSRQRTLVLRSSLIDATGMSHSPLGKLPAELRNSIYESALKHLAPLRIRKGWSGYNGGRRLMNDDRKIANLPSLLLACKQMYRECSTMLYSLNTFYFDVGLPDKATSSWDIFGQIIGPHNREVVGKVVANIDRYACGPDDFEIGEISSTYNSLAAWVKTVEHAEVAMHISIELPLVKSPLVLVIDLRNWHISCREAIERIREEGRNAMVRYMLQEVRRELEQLLEDGQAKRIGVKP